MVAVLALSIFVLGTSEFMITGLLPEMARDLAVEHPADGLPHLGVRGRHDRRSAADGRGDARDAAPHHPRGVAGGVRGRPRARRLASDYGVVLVARVLTALATATFWVVAAVVTVSVACEHLRARDRHRARHPSGHGHRAAAGLAGHVLVGRGRHRDHRRVRVRRAVGLALVLIVGSIPARRGGAVAGFVLMRTLLGWGRWAQLRLRRGPGPVARVAAVRPPAGGARRWSSTGSASSAARVRCWTRSTAPPAAARCSSRSRRGRTRRR